MDSLATGSIEYAIEEVSTLKNMYTKIEDIHCIDDCLFHLRRAREALVDGLKNSKEWAQETEEAMKTLIMLTPFLVMMNNTRLHSAP